MTTSLRKIWLRCLCLLVPALCCRAQDYSLPYVFTTLAGASSVGSVDGPGQAARFYHPSGIATDKAGSIYITDTFNNVIRKITPAGAVSTLAGAPGQPGSADGMGRTARFNHPSGIMVDPSGNVYVSDNANCLIRKITPSGVVTTLAGQAGVSGYADGTGSAATFLSPGPMVMDSKGTLIVVDSGRLLRRITPTGEVTTFAGRMDTDGTNGDSTLPNARLDGVNGIMIDSADILYIVDGTQRTIRKITPAGLVVVMAGTPLYSQDPVTPSVDGDKNTARFSIVSGGVMNGSGIYVSDNGTIRKVSLLGDVTTIAGRPGAVGADDGQGSAASFYGVTALTSDDAGNIFLADNGNNTIRKMTPGGLVSTVAGLSFFDAIGEADGTGTGARFDAPWRVATDASANVYVADEGNSTIRKITPAGVVSTLAGKAGEQGYVDGPSADARFDRPYDLAVDAAGNVYVDDSGNNVIRKITPAGVVSTFAGKAGQKGTDDGVGDNARFTLINAMSIDRNGMLYVADAKSMRKISPAGEVTTLTGFAATMQPHSFISGLAIDAAGVIYACDPTYWRIIKGNDSIGYTVLSLSSFVCGRIAVAGSGKIFVTEYPTGDGKRIGLLSLDGSVGILAGPAGTGRQGYITGNTDGLGADVRFLAVSDMAVDTSENLYVPDSIANVVRKGQLATVPVITTQPATQSAAAGTSVQFSVVAASATPMTYQWLLNGAPIANATASSYTLAAVQSAQAGDYTVMVGNAAGNVISSKATLTVTASTTPPPPTTGGGGSSGGGGGAPSLWFAMSLSGLSLIRWLKSEERGKSGA